MGAPTCVHVECSTYMTYMKLDMYPTVALNNYEPYFNISTSLQTIDRTTRQIVHNTQEASHLVHMYFQDNRDLSLRTCSPINSLREGGLYQKSDQKFGASVK